MGPGGSNEYQAGVLDDVPVVLIAGDRFTAAGVTNPSVWPNDGVARWSVLAPDVDDRVLPHRRGLVFDDTHGIYVSENAALPWTTGLTWDPAVLDAVRSAVDGADGALAAPNRQGCH